MRTVDIDQGAVRRSHANVDALSLDVIYGNEWPSRSLLERDRQAVALPCAEGQACSFVQIASLGDDDGVGRDAEFYEIQRFQALPLPFEQPRRGDLTKADLDTNETPCETGRPVSPGLARSQG